VKHLSLSAAATALTTVTVYDALSLVPVIPAVMTAEPAVFPEMTPSLTVATASLSEAHSAVPVISAGTLSEEPAERTPDVAVNAIDGGADESDDESEHAKSERLSMAESAAQV
jgi:hypothetical protein